MMQTDDVQTRPCECSIFSSGLLYSRENPLKCIMFYIMGGANSVQTLRVQSRQSFLPPLSPFPFSPGRATPSSPRSPISRPRVKTRSKTPLFGLLAKEGAVLQSSIIRKQMTRLSNWFMKCLKDHCQAMFREPLYNVI